MCGKERGNNKVTCVTSKQTSKIISYKRSFFFPASCFSSKNLGKHASKEKQAKTTTMTNTWTSIFIYILMVALAVLALTFLFSQVVRALIDFHRAGYIPGPPPRLFGLGLRDLLRKGKGVFGYGAVNWMNEHKERIVRVWYGTKQFMLTIDPSAAETILVKENWIKSPAVT
jgi:hypothetical protein